MKGGHAEIVGAGFGGLVAAVALAERGWTVRVHERRDTLAGEGYGIAIHNNMARIFATFGILEHVLVSGMRIDRRDSLDRHGRVVMTRTTARSPYRIDRQHIVTLLAGRALKAGAEIEFNSHVTAADPAGAVTFANGETRRADLVVAADGINSDIRDQLGLLQRRIFGRDLRRAHQPPAAAGGNRRRRPRRHGDDRGLKLPWIAAQYVRAANYVPTGCHAGVNIDARMAGADSA